MPRFYRVRLILFLLLALVALVLVDGGALHAQPAGPTQPVILEHADTISGYVEAGQKVNVFIGGVRFTQGVVQIQADRAVHYPEANRAVLTGNVRVTQPGIVLTAPRAEYDGASRMATASSGVVIRDGDATLRANSGRYSMVQRIAYFDNGVTLTDPQATLRAGAGEYYSIERRAVFRSGVRVESDSGTITARELTYWRDTEETNAVGNVVLIPKQREARLTGDNLRHQPSIGYTLVLGSPKLVNIDTLERRDETGALRRDTTVITAVKMESFRGPGREEYVATDSMRLRRGDLEAVARIGRYLPGEEVITLGSGRPRTAPADSTVSAQPDSGAVPGSPSSGTPTMPGAGQPPSVADGSFPIVWYRESQLTGDTITVGLLRKSLSSIDVLGDGFAVTEGKAPERFDQLAGRRLFFDIAEDTIRQVRSEGLASSIYFLYDSDRPNGVNRASGDTMRINFSEGEVSRIKVNGRGARSEGEYFPEPRLIGQESSFRLQGFRWIPRQPKVQALDGDLPNAPSIPAVNVPDPDSR